MLAKRAVVGRARRQEKAANDGSDPLGAAFNWIKENPVYSYPMIGAAGGAALGGLLNVGKEKEDRTVLPSMATGALAGGGLGLGTAMLGVNETTNPYFGWAVSDKAKNPFKAVSEAGTTALGGNLPSEKVLEDLGQKAEALGIIAPGTWATLPEEQRKPVIQKVVKHIQGLGGTSVLDYVPWDNPVATGAGAAGIHALQGRPSVTALRAGLGTPYASSDAVDPRVIEHIREKNYSQQKGLARAGSRLNPNWWLRPNRTITTVPATPTKAITHPNIRGGEIIPGKPAVPVGRGLLRDLQVHGRAGPATWSSRLGRGIGNTAKYGLGGLTIWNLASRLSQMNKREAGRRTIEYFRSLNYPDEQIKSLMDDEMWVLGQAALQGTP